MRFLPRPPTALIALLAAVALVGLAWALIMPAWQAPDENAHFAYVQSLSEQGRLPQDAARPLASTEQLRAADAVNSDQTAATLATKPEWDPGAYERWRVTAAALGPADRADGGGPNPAGPNPPLYYAAAAAADELAGGGDIFARLVAMRLLSVALLLVTVSGAWLLAGEVFGRDRGLQLAAAAVAGLAPMVSFISASVSPDAALYALWSIALWLGVRVAQRGLTPSSGTALLAVTGLAVVTKATSWALVPAALFVLAVGARRLATHGRRRALITIAASLSAFLVPVIGWLALLRTQGRAPVEQAAGGGAFDARQFLSYVWQTYLPELPFQTRFSLLTPLPLYDSWVKTGLGAFGWLEVVFPEPLYVVLTAVLVVAAAAALAGLVGARRRVEPAAVGFVALAAIALVAGLHWTEYNVLLGGGKGFSQGRYLFPLIAVVGLAFAQAVRALGPRRRLPALGLLLGALCALQIYSLALVLTRFYA